VSITSISLWTNPIKTAANTARHKTHRFYQNLADDNLEDKMILKSDDDIVQDFKQHLIDEKGEGKTALGTFYKTSTPDKKGNILLPDTLLHSQC
jgi:hypothetical protein